MWLAYFDENKFDLATGRDSFWIGGVYVSEAALPELDFSAYKQAGSTKYWFGRSLDAIHDTIYFTYSHHSRFLQAAYLMVYLAARFDHQELPPAKWHEAQAWAIWQKIKASVNIQRWP